MIKPFYFIPFPEPTCLLMQFPADGDGMKRSGFEKVYTIASVAVLTNSYTMTQLN